MTTINSKSNKITINADGTAYELAKMQHALIDLMQRYNYKEFGGGCEDTMYFSLELLKATIPDPDSI